MKRNFILIMFSNVIYLILNVLTNFLLPKYLSIDSYSQIKTFSLYLSYAGFFSLGYIDGMYLEYGGKKIENIDNKELAYNFLNYAVLELLLFIIVLFIGIYFNNYILSVFAFGMLSANLLGYFKSFYQAIGEFKLYGFCLNAEKIAIVLGNLILLFLLKTDNYKFYILLQVIVGLIILFVLYIFLNKKKKIYNEGKISLSIMIKNIKLGFVLMLGNFSSAFFTGIDRWFVKILMSSYSFALYAFAVSVENIINTFISPISISLYNYFCNKENQTRIKIIKIKKYILIWTFLVLMSVFPIKWILKNLLNQYVGAIKIVIILFAAQIFYSLIKGIYVNLYKVEKKQSKYLIQMIFMIIISIILNIALYKVNQSYNSIAVATLITSIIWFFYCEYEYKEIRFSIKDYIYIFINLFSFISISMYMNEVVGLFLFLFIYIVTIIIFMPNEFNSVLNDVNNILKRVIEKYTNQIN